MESRPKRRSIPSSSAAPAPPEDSTEGSQVGVMGNVVESLRRKQEEASTRRQLLILRSKLEKEIRESEVPPSVAVSSEEEAQEELTEEPTEKPTEELTEEPTEKPTEELTEEPTEKPTEELAEEPTEKPTKELAKEDGESDEDAWGRWRGPLEDASSSWHGTTAPMEPPEGPSVDALGRQKERDAAQWTGPTTALGRSSIWYDPEAEEKPVVPEGGAKKKKKEKKESAPAKGAVVEEVPETPPPSEEQLQVQRIQELFQTFGPEETGDLPVEGEMESSSPTVDVLAVPTEPEPATMGPTVPLEPVPETEDAGGEAKKKKRKRRKKKASQACAGDVVMVEEDPAEGAGGVGDIDLGAGDAGGVETIDVESAGPVDQKKRKKKKGARSWYHRLTPKRTPLWYHRLVCRSGQKKRRKKKKRSSQNSSCGGAFRRRGGAGAGDGAAGAGDGASGPEMVPRVPEMVPLTPAPFPPPALLGGGAYDCGRSDGGRSDCGHSGCGPCGCGTYGCGGLSRVKAEAVSKSSGSCSCIRSFAAAAVAATASRACGSVCPTCCRSSSRSTAFWSQSLGIKPGAEALGSASWDTKESSSQKGARAFSVNLMLGYPRVSVFARKRFSVRRRGRRLWQRCGFQSGESLVLLGRAKAEVQVLRLPQYRFVVLSWKGFEVECKAQNPKEAWRFSRVLCEGCCACKAREPTVEAWRFSESVQVFAEASFPREPSQCVQKPSREPSQCVQKPSREPSQCVQKPSREPSKQCVAAWWLACLGRLSGLLLACLGRLLSMLLVCLGWLCLSVR